MRSSYSSPRRRGGSMERSRSRPKTTRQTLCLLCLLCLMLAACGNLTSTGFDQAQPASRDADIGGIPFTLNKPRFTVTRVPSADGGPDVYQTKIDFIPDSAQRYVVKMSP